VPTPLNDDADADTDGFIMFNGTDGLLVALLLLNTLRLYGVLPMLIELAEDDEDEDEDDDEDVDEVEYGDVFCIY
jgi:hypothetical protein